LLSTGCRPRAEELKRICRCSRTDTTAEGSGRESNLVAAGAKAKVLSWGGKIAKE